MTSAVLGQESKNLSEFHLDKADLESHLRFLASDELQGRRTGTEENNIAARYVAEQFRAFGVVPIPGQDSYFQTIPLFKIKPPFAAKMLFGGNEFEQGNGFLILSGQAAEIDTTAVFAGHGWVDEESGYDDYKGLDVRGKVVFVLPGPPDAKGPMEIFRAMSKKRIFAAERGAAGLIELFRLNFPWQFFKNFFNKERLEIAEEEDNAGADSLTYGWLNEKSKDQIAELMKGKKIGVKLSNGGTTKKRVPSNNVVGLIEGTDSNLKEEFLLLTAHYDHLGAGKESGSKFNSQDTIFNGARDNGMGTVALLAAAKSLAENPPNRSVIVMALTGEEVGLLGSSYFAEHPLIPLNKIIFNLNNDGAGYSDTTSVSVIGFGRTGTDEDLKKAAATFGLTVFPNPAPEQNLFDRSDNVAFAKKGIPAIDFSPGITGLDDKIMKYYHQVTDEANSIDYDYLLKFCQAYALTARLIANKRGRPTWEVGDKYEEAGKNLYKN